jgi:hypothetical protein
MRTDERDTSAPLQHGAQAAQRRLVEVDRHHHARARSVLLTTHAVAREAGVLAFGDLLTVLG